MTYQNQELPSSDDVAGVNAQSYVDWSAIIAGIVLAAAISIVMLAFGSALGLSFSSATTSTKGSIVGVGIAAALWFIWVQVSSYMAGAYLTGRMRIRKRDSSLHEVEVRDGSHGLLVWAGAVLLGTYLALSGASSLVNSVGSVAKTASESAATVVGSAAGAAASPMQYYTDTLLRSPSTSASGSPAASAAPASPDTAAPATPAVSGAPSAPRADRAAMSSEVNTILMRSSLSAPTPEDKDYLAQMISQQSGVPADVAKKRVDDTYANIDKAKADVAKAADSARRLGIIAAFLLAASMLVSAAAAYWAATLGGSHRDDAVIFTGFFRRT